MDTASSSTPHLYRNGVLYEMLMFALYGTASLRRLRTLSALVPDGARVLDVCSGPCTLQRFLRRTKNSSYVGIDMSREFVAAARKRGVDARVVDVAKGQWPAEPFDYVFMIASLYQFHPNESAIMDRLFSTAQKAVIISEPVRNISTSPIGFLATLAKHTTSVSAESFRFTETSFDDFMEQYRPGIIKTGHIPGGREKYVMIDPGLLARKNIADTLNCVN